MLKEVIRALDSGILPLIGLLSFLVAFIAIVAWAFLMKKEDREAAKQQPLQDLDEVLASNNHSYGN